MGFFPSQLFTVVQYPVPCRDGGFNGGALPDAWARVGFMGWLLREARSVGGDTRFLKRLYSFLISVRKLGIRLGSLFLESQRIALPKNSSLWIVALCRTWSVFTCATVVLKLDFLLHFCMQFVPKKGENLRKNYFCIQIFTCILICIGFLLNSRWGLHSVCFRPASPYLVTLWLRPLTEEIASPVDLPSMHVFSSFAASWGRIDVTTGQRRVWDLLLLLWNCEYSQFCVVLVKQN